MAAEAFSDVSAFAAYLNVSEADLRAWISGESRPPNEVFFKALDLIAAGPYGPQQKLPESGGAQHSADRLQQSADRAQQSADRAQQSANRAQQSADRAQGTASRAQDFVDQQHADSEQAKSDLDSVRRIRQDAQRGKKEKDRK